VKNAALAWDRDDYVAALTTYHELLTSPDAHSLLEPIALQTGELYRTTELTVDGAPPQFAPSGQYATFETGTGATRVTHVASLANRSNEAALAVRRAADLAGYLPCSHLIG